MDPSTNSSEGDTQSLLTLEPDLSTGTVPGRPPPNCFARLEPTRVSAEISMALFLYPVNLYKSQPCYRIGRGDHNDYILDDPCISNSHCTIKWNGLDTKAGTVILADTSSNGTVVRGTRRHRSSIILRDGDEITMSLSNDKSLCFMFKSDIPMAAPIMGCYLRTKIGEGSYGEVHQAISETADEEYAIKTLRFPFSPNKKEEWQQIDREIQCMLALKHPNIVPLYDYKKDQEEQKIYLKMEYLAGGNLLDYVTGHSGEHGGIGLGEEMTRYFTRQIIDAVAHMHEQKIAHRDLKLENIVLTAAEPPVLKVTDFGVSKKFTGEDLMTIAGTPEYIAPEITQRLPGEPYNEAVDSFSIGVIVFNMLTGSYPFIEPERKENISLAERVRTRRPCLEILDGMDLTSRCRDFVNRLLFKDPKTRLKVADALAHPWFAVDDADEQTQISALDADDTLVANVTVNMIDAADLEPSQMSIVVPLTQKDDPENILHHSRESNRSAEASMMSVVSVESEAMSKSQHKRKRLLSPEPQLEHQPKKAKPGDQSAPQDSDSPRDRLVKGKAQAVKEGHISLHKEAHKPSPPATKNPAVEVKG